MVDSKGFLGLFVHPAYCQDRGVEPLFDEIAEYGFNAVCITPKVAIADESGVRFPPLHGDGTRRVLSQPLMGSSEPRLRFAMAQPPMADYPPGQAPAAIGNPSDIPSLMIEEAHRRGWDAHILIQPLVMPNVESFHAQTRIDGRIVGEGITPLACPSSPLANEFATALVEDVVSSYPSLDGLVLDWAEFGAYRLGDLFACCCRNCMRSAEDIGIAPDRLLTGLRLAYRWALDTGRLSVLPMDVGAVGPGERSLQWLQELKAHAVYQLHRTVRSCLSRLASDVTLTTRVWTSPWHRMSGADRELLATTVDVIAPKYFFFDFAAIPGWYAQELTQSGRSEHDLLTQLTADLGLPDDLTQRSIGDYCIPGPAEAHRVGFENYVARFEADRRLVRQSASVVPFLHSYLPDWQWSQVARQFGATTRQTWIHMYGYLSDQKLDTIRTYLHPSLS